MATSLVSRNPQVEAEAEAEADGMSSNGPANASDPAAPTPKHVWDHYLQYRPSYPDSMWHVWLDYHRGPLQTIHEVGTGCGIATANLLRVAKGREGNDDDDEDNNHNNNNNAMGSIQHVILSDPSESNITVCKDFLVSSSAAPGVSGVVDNTLAAPHFTYLSQPAETCTITPPGSVDMVFACECLHWTRIEAALARMHDSLRPGGTMCAVYYDVGHNFVHGNPRASQALETVYAEIAIGAREGRHTVKWGTDGGDGDGSGGGSNAETDNKKEEQRGQLLLRQRRNAHLGLNFVPFPKDMWEDVRRVYINLPEEAEGDTEWPLFEVYKAQGALGREDSKVDVEGGEVCEWIRDVDGWAVTDCTTEWVKGMFETAVAFGQGFWEGEVWAEFVNAVREKDGTSFRAVFRAAYVMARKR